MLQCSICGRPLPNRYAVAGKCAHDGCDAVFCALHWHNGNRLCGDHGWKPGGLLESAPEPEGEAGVICEGQPAREKGEEVKVVTEEQKAGENAPSENEIRAKAQKLLTREQAAGILHSVAEFAGKLGKSAASLVLKIKNAHSPETVLSSIDSSLEANRTARAPLMARADKLYAEIVAKKKAYQAAAPARKKLLELELKSLLSEYKGIERQMTAFFENENTLNTVRGRVLELMALGMRKVDEATIDRLTDDIEDAVGEAEDVAGAVRDLDKAGKRHENEDDRESFDAALAGFEDEGLEPAAEAGETDSFAIDPPVRSAGDVGESQAKSPVADEP